MFSRIQEAIRVITYREPDTGQDAVIVEHVETTPTPAGKRIAIVLESLVAISVVGYLSARVGDRLIDTAFSKHLSMSAHVLIGSIAAFFVLAVNWLKHDLEHKFRIHFRLADRIAPFFGKRIDNALRVLRGSVRAS
jgi:hypothetical protein